MASLLALLGVALASEYLFPRPEESSDESRLARSGLVRKEAVNARGRGRQTATPSEISPRSWKDILVRVYANVSKHRVLALAAGMTYYSILAIFPAIAALVAMSP